MNSQVIMEVEKILKRNRQARSSDKILIMEYIERCSGFKNLDKKTKDNLAKAIIQDMPAFETITRARRELQERGLYQADAKTQAQRRALEKAVRLRYRK